MRTAPLNFVIAVASGLSFWVLTAFATAGYIADSVALNLTSIADFLFMYRVALAVAALAGLVGIVIWLFYGGLPGVSLALNRARQVWVGLWFSELLVAGLLVAVLMLQLVSEPLTAWNLIFLFTMMSVHTWLFFWIASLILSPKTVKHLPWLS